MAGLAKRYDVAQERDRIIRFVLLGAANTAFAFGVYAGSLAIGLTYQLASLVALFVGILTGFVLQGKVAFQTQLRGRFIPFVGLWTLLYLANIVLIGAFALFGFNYYWAGLVAAVPLNILSFLALRNLIFAEERPGGWRLLLCWCLGLVAVTRLYIVTHLSVNWDEFLNLSMLYDFRRGEMTEIFQTAFIHIFRWLPLVSVNEADQVIAARFVGLLCVAITSWAIYRASRRFMDKDRALVSVLAFNCFSYSLLYGTDFRTDTFATAAMMSAVALALHRQLKLGRTMLIGALIAFSGAMTIKAVFMLPTIIVLLLIAAFEAGDLWRSVRTLAAGATTSLFVFVSILILHASSLQEQASAVGFLGRTGGATLLTGDYTILSTYWKLAFLFNPGFWLLVIVGVATGQSPGAVGKRSERVALLVLVFPALTPAIYSEVYPYFHPFMVAPLAVLTGYGFSRMSRLSGFALIGILLLSAEFAVVHRMDERLTDQRSMLTLIHRIFPQPVPYIDHTSMVSSYPKQGFFMSTWGVADYRATGKPMMREVMVNSQPIFLLQTRDLLAVDRLPPDVSEASPKGLFAKDVIDLRDNYQRYWGALFLPGKVLTGTGQTQILIGGRYRLESVRPITLGGHPVKPGASIVLEPGKYCYSASGSTRLLWDAPAPPASEPPGELFRAW